MTTDGDSKTDDERQGQAYFRSFGPPLRTFEHPLYGQDRRFTVFYVWQSDTPSEFNRDFIRRALDRAAEKINAEATRRYNVVIDQDTADVPGLCDIPATILSKISRADAVVADLTFIATSERSRKLCSNPNVLFELGFAFHSIGWNRLICVMNEAFGSTTSQIFDLDHRRHPIRYKLHDGISNREVILERLAKSLEAAIGGVLTLGRLADNSQEFERPYGFLLREMGVESWLYACFVHHGGTDVEWDDWVSKPPPPNVAIDARHWTSDNWNEEAFRTAKWYAGRREN